MSSLGSRLKEAREKKRLTQLEVANKLGISNGTLSGYERNYRDPDTETLRRLADLYDESVDWLTGNNQNRYSKIKNEEKIVPQEKTAWIIKKLVEKYDLDLANNPEAESMLEDLIQMVAKHKKS